MEWLRVQRNGNGWLPEASERAEDFIWGSQPFAIGIWVGAGVTPNRLGQERLDGVTRRLRAKINDRHFDVERDMDGISVLIAGHLLDEAAAKRAPEPAQVLKCPACPATLSYPRRTENATCESTGSIHLVVNTDAVVADLVNEIEASIDGVVAGQTSHVHHHGDINTISVELDLQEGIHEASIERVGRDIRNAARRLGSELTFCAVRPSRPGYFLRLDQMQGNHLRAYDFEIRCPDPECSLNKSISWQGRLPAGLNYGRRLRRDRPTGNIGYPIEVANAWRRYADDETVARGVPIPAFTVDEQVYSRLPSVVISTVDKIARMPFEPRVGNIFGNVDHHHETRGFTRAGAGQVNELDVPSPNARIVDVSGGLTAPELVIQDELHLIEGPLGSMVGFYETIVEELISEGLPDECRPKYIASTATIRSANPQVRCLYDRSVHLFPPKGPNWSDRGLSEK